jgi:DNA polymerase
MEARLSSETDLSGFREEARALLAHQVPPEAVQWQTAHAQNADYYTDSSGLDRTRGTPKTASAIVPASFLRLCEVVVLHSAPDRFDLLYRLLWRLVHEPGLRNDPADADMSHAHQMGQAVRRDLHKMKTLLRFRVVDDGDAMPLQMAWYEPSHHIVETAAPFFARRFPDVRWVILTPERCVESDGSRLHIGPGLSRAQAPSIESPDADWLAAYRSVFDEHAIASRPKSPA